MIGGGARAALAALLALVACGADRGAVDIPADVRRAVLRHSPLGAPPPDPTNAVADDPRAARLGQWLYFDHRLSADGTIACVTCHDPAKGWGDGLALGRGLGDLRRHTPSLWNVAWNRWFFWDGRADSAWAQALKPLEHPREHGGSRVAFVRLLADDASLRAAYEALFERVPSPDDGPGIDRAFANVGKVIAAFERRIVSGAAPFDEFVEGLRRNDPARLAVLSPDARRGLVLFFGRGRCASCHVGPTFSDGEFHDTGLGDAPGAPRDGGRAEGVRALLADPFNALGRYSDAPAGAPLPVRYLTVQPEQDGQFKTPSLRNVAETAPYMHDGRFATLEQVVGFYSTLDGARFRGHHRERLLRPLQLTRAEVGDMVAFLRALTGAPIDPALGVPPPSPM